MFLSTLTSPYVPVRRSVFSSTATSPLFPSTVTSLCIPVYHDVTPFSCPQMLPIYASFFHVMFITADRYIAVAFPSKYADTQLLRGVRIGYSLTWLYLCLLAVLALPFSEAQWTPHSDVCQPGIRLPAGYFILVVAGHILPCAVISVALFVRIRYILRVHQCQIQVTNTITYDNLLKDTHAAKVCFMAFVLTTFAWTPFVVCQLLRVGGVRQEALHIANSVSFLFGQVGYLKFVLYFTKDAGVGAGLKNLFT